MANTFERVAFLAAQHDGADRALKQMRHLYGHVPIEEADVLVALGGDGFMLECLHGNLDRKIPIYGMNRGSVGFLMNSFSADGLLERIGKAEPETLHPLAMTVETQDGETHHELAFNEVALLRQTHYAAKLKIFVDGIERLDEMICDGVLVATPAGSTAYNLSAHGTIVPIGAELLALTPISPFRPRRWRGALLPSKAEIKIDVLTPDRRPVSATADFHEVRGVKRVQVAEDRSVGVTILFDQEHSMEERILKEQFEP